MHAQNQQDLIYKRGQAGITKASVTIVFDDSERDKSPVGFENCKQITVTRQVRFLLLPCVDSHDRIALQIALPDVSKYLLNGHKSLSNFILPTFRRHHYPTTSPLGPWPLCDGFVEPGT